MPFTPDLPFPKSAGDAVRSKDWNDLVTETKRLDTAKVERTGDTITGPLTVAAALRINDNNLYFRAGADQNHGLGWYGGAKTFAGAAPDGPVLWGNLGGALGTAPGGAQKIALSWDGNGNVAIGVPSTTLKVDIGDRIRLRQGASGTAGMWLFQSVPNEDRAFIGMVGDNIVGLYGNKGAGWSLTMDVTAGQVGVRNPPVSYAGLYINPGAVGTSAAMSYGLYIAPGATGYGAYIATNTNQYSLVTGGSIYSGNRVRDQKVHTWTSATTQVSTTSTSYTDLMSLSVSTAPDSGAYFLIQAQINGVQIMGTTNVRALFQLLLDGSQIDFTAHEFNHNGWELRGVQLSKMAFLTQGSHTLTLRWATTAGTLTACWYNDTRQIMVIEL